jgi:hypothetical protein
MSSNRRQSSRSKGRRKTLHAADLLRSLPEEVLEQIGSQTGVDRHVSRLRGALMLQLLVIGMIEGNDLSTRMLAQLYNSPLFKFLSAKGDHRTAHSSIADRLSTISPQYFQQIFEWLYDKYHPVLEKSQLGRRIKRFDSTLVPISSGLVDFGMAVGAKPKQGYRKHQIKFTLELHGKLPKSVRLFTKQKQLSEQTALRQAISEADFGPQDVVVFDAGLSDRKTFVAFDHQDICFVSRLKTPYRAKKIAVHRQIEGRKADGLKFLRDDRVRLYSSSENLVEHDFRLIEVLDIDKGTSLVFVTNNWELSAMDIARIYRRRWDIEVFFRFLKQNLNFSNLVNYSLNGIQVQMYAALITAILLLVYQDKNRIQGHNVARLRFLHELIDDAYRQMYEPPRSLKPPDKTKH